MILQALLLLAPAALALDHSAWDALLKRYVNQQHRVDYARWKQRDLPALDGYLGSLAEPWTAALAPAAEKAALINAYNALTIRWVLNHYPIVSIWKTKQPFREARHKLNGAPTSLDAIETSLRKMGDPRIHSALVCAARSCPPLRREAYVPERIDSQLKANTTEWLTDPNLSSFDPKNRRVELSMIFKWYRDDFLPIETFLANHAPQHEWLREGSISIRHKDYHWGLNDSGSLGANYSRLSFYWDTLRNR